MTCTDAFLPRLNRLYHRAIRAVDDLRDWGRQADAARVCAAWCAWARRQEWEEQQCESVN